MCACVRYHKNWCKVQSFNFSFVYGHLSRRPPDPPDVFSSIRSHIMTDFPTKRPLSCFINGAFPDSVWAPFNVWASTTVHSFLLIDHFMSAQRGSDGRRQRRHWLLSKHLAKGGQVSGTTVQTQWSQDSKHGWLFRGAEHSQFSRR